MRDPARIDKVIGALRTLWQSNPDLRLGQLVENLATGHPTFYIEDDEMYERIVGALGNNGALGSEKRCAKHGDMLIREPGGPDMPTIRGRWYCPTCQDEFNKALQGGNQ